MAVEDCAGVVLAGGTSTRFADGNKALATIDGVPSVRRVADRLGSVVDGPVVVSVRTQAQTDELRGVFAGCDSPPTIARDAEERDGPLAGVSAALNYVETERFALVACDMPLFEPGVVEWLVSRSQGADAVVPAVEEPQPLQALYRTGTVEAGLSAVPASAGMFVLLDELDSVRQVSDSPPAVALERSLTNVNTVDGLQVARDSIAGGGSDEQ